MVMRQQRTKGSWHPLLIKLMQFAVRNPKLARKLVKDHPEALKLRNGIGETALHYLAVENYADAVQLLIDLGADAYVGNYFGATALQEATKVRANEAAEVLKRAKRLSHNPPIAVDRAGGKASCGLRGGAAPARPSMSKPLSSASGLVLAGVGPNHLFDVLRRGLIR